MRYECCFVCPRRAQPTPLYVMDEIDAALDFKNVSIVANYIKERTKNAQFVIISLRNNMFELADRLIGIYKTHDVTKCVAINPKELVVPAGGAASAGTAVVSATARARAVGTADAVPDEPEGGADEVPVAVTKGSKRAPAAGAGRAGRATRGATLPL
jgi:hypothetical protein